MRSVVRMVAIDAAVANRTYIRREIMNKHKYALHLINEEIERMGKESLDILMSDAPTLQKNLSIESIRAATNELRESAEKLQSSEASRVFVNVRQLER